MAETGDAPPAGHGELLREHLTVAQLDAAIAHWLSEDSEKEQR